MKNLSICRKLPEALASVSFRLLAGVLAFSVVVSQTAFAAGPQADSTPSQPAARGFTVEVPSGTVIPLTLVSQIKSKSTKVGDTVRAQVAFPVTAGTVVAIPAGTFVEGVVTSLTASAKKTHQPEVQINFTRLVYANGYVAALNATKTEASNRGAGAAPSEQFAETTMPAAEGGDRSMAFYGGEGFTYAAQVTPPTSPFSPLPALPQNLGPSRGLLIGLGVGIPVLLVVVGTVIGSHHRSNSDSLLYDAGWQFQMTLAAPLTLDEGQVIAAAAVGTR